MSATKTRLDNSTTPQTAARFEPANSLTLAIMVTLAIVVSVRETALIVCSALGYASAANIVGMMTLLIALLICRFTIGLPHWLTQASNVLLLESGFAFLPVSAGAGLLVFGLGDELWGFIITILISTMLPLWGIAKLANLWLSTHDRTTVKPKPSKPSKLSKSPKSSSL